jgi:GTPase involved in cell partitioning and DNA repair
VIFEASERMHTLMDFRYKRKFTAGNGGDGMANRRTGKSGEPVVIEVAESGVSYDDGTSLSESGDGIVVDNVTGMVTISISNVSGFELPASGGSGMSSTLRAIGLLVVALVVVASLGLWGGLRGRHYVR